MGSGDGLYFHQMPLSYSTLIKHTRLLSIGAKVVEIPYISVASKLNTSTTARRKFRWSDSPSLDFWFLQKRLRSNSRASHTKLLMYGDSEEMSRTLLDKAQFDLHWNAVQMFQLSHLNITFHFLRLTQVFHQIIQTRRGFVAI
jgi:hypothetical protein